MEIKTNFLAEEWLEVLEKKVKPSFPGVEFTTYTPEKRIEGEIKSPKIIINISDKAAFVYNLQGRQTNPRIVIDSLRRYVYLTTKKVMNEK
jgi:hypothetical protein